MKKSIIHYLLILTVSFLLLISYAFTKDKYRIAVIPKTEIGTFWKSIHAGVKLSSVALGVNIEWKVPFEYSTPSQISLIEQSVEEGVSGIILAPLQRDSVVSPVANAMKKKIPVIIFDTEIKGIAGKDYVCFVGIDNKKGGSLAGKQIVELLAKKGRVLVLRAPTNIDQPNIVAREKGFLETIALHKNIQIIEYVIQSGSDVDNVKDECLKISEKLKTADAVFCSYEQSTIGTLLAMRQIGIAGKIKFVGFDTPKIAIEALKKGEIHALIAQDPARMGYLSVKSMVDYLEGKKIDPVVNVDARIITQNNLDDPEIQKLLALPITDK